MHDEQEWVPVEVTWDEDLADADETLDWDERPWLGESLYDPRPRPSYPPLPPGFVFSTRLPDDGGKRRPDRDRPKRQKADTHLSKRKRKKMRAWEIEDEA